MYVERLYRIYSEQSVLIFAPIGVCSMGENAEMRSMWKFMHEHFYKM